MPRKKSGTFDQMEYIKQYNRANIKYRKINFNVNNQEDVDIMEWIDKHQQSPGTSAYLKELVRADMEKHRQAQTEA